MSAKVSGKRKPLIVRPDQGRKYEMGGMRAVFFADGEETGSRYSISEWWLEPRTRGPGAHAHEDDHIFYVLAGTLRVVIEGRQNDAERGTYVVIPGGVPHDFENHGKDECRFISINVPGGFEEMMPQLVTWFGQKPLRSVHDA